MSDAPLRILVTKATMDDLARSYVELRKKKDQLDHELEMIAQQLTEKMENLSEKTLELNDGGKVQRLTYVRSTSTSVDEKGLKHQLGEERYAKYCDLKLNKTKLEKALDAGEVTIEEVSPHVSEKRSRPYIRYSEGAAHDGSAQEEA